VLRLALVLWILLLTGCGGVGALNALIPRGGWTRTEGIAYGLHPRQQLDVYRPRDARTPRPVVVFFYGGRWDSGARDLYPFVGEALTARGAVVIVPDYRLYPSVVFPAFVEDAALAVRWARENAARWNGDPDRILLVGHSAGAHLALLLALDERYLRDAGVPQSAIRGAVGIAGPYDFLPLDEDLRPIFGPPEQWPDTQPIRFVDGDEPPILLLSAGADRVVDGHNAPNLAARIREMGGRVQHIEYPRLGHLSVLLALAHPLRRLGPVRRDVGAFLRAVSHR
jgi:acetyl esterase/lipase